MNYDNLFVFPNGRTSRDQYIGAVITLLLAFAFYHFLVPGGRNNEWVKLTFLFPALMLHARRLQDMGKTALLLILPGGLLLATAYFVLFDPMNSAKTAVMWAAVAISALFILWGLVGKSKP